MEVRHHRCLMADALQQLEESYSSVVEPGSLKKRNIKSIGIKQKLFPLTVWNADALVLCSTGFLVVFLFSVFFGPLCSTGML